MKQYSCAHCGRTIYFEFATDEHVAQWVTWTPSRGVVCDDGRPHDPGEDSYGRVPR